MSTSLRIVIVLLVISLVFGALMGGDERGAILYRLAYLWALLLIGGWLMSQLSLRGVQLTRTARALRSQVGQIFEERYEIVNPSRIPRLWIEVKNESNLPGSSGSHVLTLIGARESRTYLARTRLTSRGIFHLGPTELISGDLFGLFPIRRKESSRDSLLVYPLVFDVASFPNPPGLLPGGEALHRRTAQITSNASGVREYTPGDPMNRIHWVSTARRNRLIVKEFELDPLAEVWIFLDASHSVQAELPRLHPESYVQAVADIWRRDFKFELPPSTLEYSISIAASLARYYLTKGRAVGLGSASSSLQILPADRGARQLGKILENLAVLQAEGDLPLHSLVETQARHLPRGSTAVLITPSSSDVVFQLADILLRRGLRPVSVLLDGATFGGQNSPDRLTASLEFLGIPVIRIKNGDNLTEVLSHSRTINGLSA